MGPEITLTPAEVETLTGATVTAEQIEVARAILEQEIGETLEDRAYGDDHHAGLAVPLVRLAWAVQAAHLALAIPTAAEGGVPLSMRWQDMAETRSEADTAATVALLSEQALALLGVHSGRWEVAETSRMVRRWRRWW